MGAFEVAPPFLDTLLTVSISAVVLFAMVIIADSSVSRYVFGTRDRIVIGSMPAWIAFTASASSCKFGLGTTARQASSPTRTASSIPPVTVRSSIDFSDPFTDTAFIADVMAFVAS